METDEELVGRIAEGNEAALAELLRRHERPLSRFLFRQTGGRDVEDLYQETWLRVFRNAGRFDPAKRFSTWLFQIAVNLCRDFHRRHDPLAADEPTDRGWSGDTARVEAGMDAGRLLTRLPGPQREVLILRYYHDLPESEIAAILDCPKGTVKSRIHNALARLGEIVRAEGAERR
jgi:RNA polymerase sigma-70 factor (ECF subfamily)